MFEHVLDMLWAGVAFALAAAGCNTGIDVLRKFGAAVVPPRELVAIVAIFDAVLSVCFVAAIGGLREIKIDNPTLFWLATSWSSALLLLSKGLYQTAIHNSPLSLTIPYLSFTPVVLLGTAFLFLGEKPSLYGVVGVGVVTLAGYFLSRRSVHTAKPPSAKAILELKFHRTRSPSYAGLLDVEAFEYDKKEHPPPNGLGDRSATHALAKADHGPYLMLSVATLWSVTASLDKIGLLHAASVSTYFVFQRVFMGVACFLYLALRARHAFAHIWKHFNILVTISLLELASVMLFLEAIEHLLVSYVVALKRFNILFSVVLGGLIFQEKVASRIPYILLMLAGMVIIVQQPGHIAWHDHKLPQH